MGAHVFSLTLSFGCTCIKDREKSSINSYQGFFLIQILIYFLIELVDTAKGDKLFFLIWQTQHQTPKKFMLSVKRLLIFLIKRIVSCPSCESLGGHLMWYSLLIREDPWDTGNANISFKYNRITGIQFLSIAFCLW